MGLLISVAWISPVIRLYVWFQSWTERQFLCNFSAVFLQFRLLKRQVSHYLLCWRELHQAPIPRLIKIYLLFLGHPRAHLLLQDCSVAEVHGRSSNFIPSSFSFHFHWYCLIHSTTFPFPLHSLTSFPHSVQRPHFRSSCLILAFGS
jgi:hypothetical protein